MTFGASYPDIKSGVAKGVGSTVSHNSILRKSGVARGWEALPMTFRGAI